MLKDIFHDIEIKYLNYIEILFEKLNKHVYFTEYKRGKTTYHITVVKFEDGYMSEQEWDNVFNTGKTDADFKKGL